VQKPGTMQLAGYFFRANWILFIPLLVFGIMLALWHSRGRDPRLRPIAVQYEPPEQMTPAELGTLADNRPDMRDITATIVDLAVRGYLLIEQTGKDIAFGLLGQKSYRFTLRKQEAEWQGLQPHEVALLHGMFSDHTVDSVDLADLQNKFYVQLPIIRNRIFDQLIARHYYFQRPDTLQQGYFVIAGLLAALTIFGAIGCAASQKQILGIAPISLVVAGLLSAVVIAVFGYFMPARTISGARALEGVLGFEEFLNRVESDRFARIIKTPEMFEKFLPYAMALGVAENWARAFQSIYTQPPDWYRGGDFRSFSTGYFIADLGHMSTQTASTMGSMPRSSGGSAFGGGGGGGGFSGGGFGGGRMGGF
jgi:uncharacterized membrane protein